MTMKRKVLILSVLAICIATLAAGTLAYYNAETTAHNVITTGSVQIAVQEWANTEKTEVFTDKTGVMPGAAVTKIAEVKNTGKGDAWVRVKIEKAIQLAGDGKVDLGLVKLDIDTTHWTAKDGYYYYNVALKAGEVTAPIFTKVTFDANMGNAYQNATATVDVTAQAVQAANNGKTITEAAGWPNA